MRLGRLHFGLKFAWYDLWFGAYWDRKKRRLYLGIPMLVLWFQWWTTCENKKWQFHSELAKKLPGTALKFEGAMVGECVSSHVDKDGNRIITDFKLDHVDLVPDLLRGAQVSMSSCAAPPPCFVCGEPSTSHHDRWHPKTRRRLRPMYVCDKHFGCTVTFGKGQSLEEAVRYEGLVAESHVKVDKWVPLRLMSPEPCSRCGKPTMEVQRGLPDGRCHACWKKSSVRSGSTE